MSESSPLIALKTHSKTTDVLNRLLDSVKSWPWLEVFFLYYMGISGALAMTVTYSISDLAANCGETATSMGVVFFTEAIGGVFGSLIAEVVYRKYLGNQVLIVIGTFLGGILMYMPYITNTYVLNVAYFIVGAIAIMIQIGCVHLVRRIEQESAGHWLALTQVANSAGSIIFFILYWKLNMTTKREYIVLSVVVWTVSATFIFVPFSATSTTSPEESSRLVIGVDDPAATPSIGPYQQEDTAGNPSAHVEESGHSDHLVKEPVSSRRFDEKGNFIPPHYYAELIVGTAAALINACGLIFTSYFYTYVEESGFESTDLVASQFTIFWTMATIGRIVGTIDQFITVTDQNLVSHALVWIVVGVIFALLWLILWKSEIGVWITTAILGFCVGPLVGYVYDWVHRLTLPSEASTTILILVAFAGGHSLMYVCALIWDAGGGPRTLMGMTAVCLVLAVPFMWWGKDISYLKRFHMNEGYQSIPTTEH